MAETTIPRIALAIGLLWSASTAWAQISPGAAPQQTTTVRDAYQGNWSPSHPAASTGKEKADDARLDLLQEAAAAEPGLDGFRAQRNAALALRHGRLADQDRAELREQAARINAARPGSFDGLMSTYYAEFPAPAGWSALDAAARLQPERLELIGPQLTHALRDGDQERLAAAAKAMRTRGEIAPALYTLADDLLLSVARDGVLIVAGEMDGFPVLVRQRAEGKRADVLVIDERLLADAQYRALAWLQANAQGAPPESGKAFIAQLHRRTARPVFLSLALGRELAAEFAGQLHVTGLAMRMTAEACCTADALLANWRAMRKSTKAGPLSRNYLVPASALLLHYRAAGDERRTAELEHELRRLAAELGATRELQANGILPH
jgi:hypothetical protein